MREKKNKFATIGLFDLEKSRIQTVNMNILGSKISKEVLPKVFAQN